ncbi:MAG: diacylglycerol kinase family lipid kinase [Planctomycetes bacterium]|nr:diacylglycerol kinase family lipid kinase [Planctomycetota bacterium]
MPMAPSSTAVRTLVVVNPVSGRGRGRTVATSVLEMLQSSGRVQAIETTRRGDAEAITRENCRSAERIVVIGGDGTVNEVVNGLGDCDIPIGQVPVGGANVLARELGIPLDPVRAARALCDAVPRRIDVGLHSGRRFLLMVGVGFDGDVIHRLAAGRGSRCGFRGYIKPFVSSFRSYGMQTFAIEVDGNRIADDAVQAVVANTRNYAGLASVASHATPDDGRLDVVVFRATSKLQLLRHGWRAWRGCVRESEGVTVRTGTRVAVVGNTDIPVQMDGDAAGFLPIDVRLCAGSVRILVPLPARSDRGGA